MAIACVPWRVAAPRSIFVSAPTLENEREAKRNAAFFLQPTHPTRPAHPTAPHAPQTLTQHLAPPFPQDAAGQARPPRGQNPPQGDQQEYHLRWCVTRRLHSVITLPDPTHT